MHLLYHYATAPGPSNKYLYMTFTLGAVVLVYRVTQGTDLIRDPERNGGNGSSQTSVAKVNHFWGSRSHVQTERWS